MDAFTGARVRAVYRRFRFMLAGQFKKEQVALHEPGAAPWLHETQAQLRPPNASRLTGSTLGPKAMRAGHEPSVPGPRTRPSALVRL